MPFPIIRAIKALNANRNGPFQLSSQKIFSACLNHASCKIIHIFAKILTGI